MITFDIRQHNNPALLETELDMQGVLDRLDLDDLAGYYVRKVDEEEEECVEELTANEWIEKYGRMKTV